MTYDALKKRMDELGMVINAPESVLPDLGKSSDFGHPHVELDSLGFHYIVSERGTQFSRETTQDLDELLYWIFRDATFSLACAYEASHRSDIRDFRRILFDHQLQLLNALSPAWSRRYQEELEETLRKNPYVDKQ